MDLELSDKVAFISGSSHGIGLEIAKTLHAEGCQVVINGRNNKNLDQASKENYHSILVDTKSNNNSSEKIAKLIVDNGWGLRNLTPLPMTLEEIFLQLTQDK